MRTCLECTQESAYKKLEFEIMKVCVGTLRRPSRNKAKCEELGLSRTVSFFGGEDSKSFKSWVKLNARLILRHYDKRPAFTLKAGKLLGV